MSGERTRLLLSSAVGFTDQLVAASAGRPDVLLVDLERLYGGD